MNDFGRRARHCGRLQTVRLGRVLPEQALLLLVCAVSVNLVLRYPLIGTPHLGLCQELEVGDEGQSSENKSQKC